MSLHKLTAGSGYDYLTRQVAAMDSTEKGYTGLASYYSERGETPGVWVGTGCEAIRPGFAGSVVTAEQMQALFGSGTSPIGPELVRALGEDASSTDMAGVVRLGSPFRLSGEASAFRVEVARQIAVLNRSLGQPATAPVSVDARAGIRTRVARDLFSVEFGRAPLDARELSGFIARASRPVATTVASFDLTFSPPKSVSTLWAVANPGIAARIEAAHREAVHLGGDCPGADRLDSPVELTNEGCQLRGLRHGQDLGQPLGVSGTLRDRRRGQLQVCGGHHVAEAVEHAEQLGHVRELGESRPWLEAGAGDVDLHVGDDLAEGRRPLVEVVDAGAGHAVGVEVALHDVHLGDAVGDRGCSGGAQQRGEPIDCACPSLATPEKA